MIDLVKFTTKDGDSVLVNPNGVAKVMPAATDKNHSIIYHVDRTSTVVTDELESVFLRLRFK